MEKFRVSSIREGGKAYSEFLRTLDLSAGVYRLPAGATDPQQPHGEDELYYVIDGRARFTTGESDTAIQPGDALFVAAKEPHRFHQITEDLELLVVFGPAEGAR